MHEGDSLVFSSVASLSKLRSKAHLLKRGSRNIHSRQSGQHLSAQKGRGMDFAESRLYQPGDDVRTLDWRVTARTGKPHTKIFQEERERPVYFLVDLRPSMFFGTRGKYKSVMAAEVASLLSWKMRNDHDRVGGLIQTTNELQEIRPGRSMKRLSVWLNAIARATEHSALEGVGEFGAPLAIDKLRKVVSTGDQVIIVSDFLGGSGNFHKHLTGLARKSSLTMIHISDPFEKTLPDTSVLHLSDGRKQFRILPRKKSLLTSHQERYQEHIKNLANNAHKTGSSLISLSTNEEENHLLLKLSRGLR